MEKNLKHRKLSVTGKYTVEIATGYFNGYKNLTEPGNHPDKRSTSLDFKCRSFNDKFGILLLADKSFSMVKIILSVTRSSLFFILKTFYGSFIQILLVLIGILFALIEALLSLIEALLTNRTIQKYPTPWVKYLTECLTDTIASREFITKWFGSLTESCDSVLQYYGFITGLGLLLTEHHGTDPGQGSLPIDRRAVSIEGHELNSGSSMVFRGFPVYHSGSHVGHGEITKVLIRSKKQQIFCAENKIKF